MKYRKKPVIIDAEQWTDHFSPRASDSILNKVLTMAAIPGDHTVNPDMLCEACGCTMLTHGWIITLEGPMRVCSNDQIIRGVRGEFYPCKPDIFEDTYNQVFEEEHTNENAPEPPPLGEPRKQ